MFNRFTILVLLAFTLFLSGCASTNKMALSNDTDTIPKSGKPLYLMTVTMRNSYKISYQPKLASVNVTKPQVVNPNTDMFNFAIDDKAKNETDSPVAGNNYLIRMELDQGEYVIKGLNSGSNSFPIFGTFYTALNENFKSSTSGVFYLGHLEAVVRERKGNELRAGSTIPLLDQAVVGASGGTFDVEVSDKWESDKQKFISKFPVLNTVAVQKLILPPFDRAKVQ